MAYHTSINVKALTTWEDCEAAIARIERTAESYTSARAYTRGAHCELKRGAQSKVTAIYKRWDILTLAEMDKGEA
jgi:hypothetical protein